AHLLASGAGPEPFVGEGHHSRGLAYRHVAVAIRPTVGGVRITHSIVEQHDRLASRDSVDAGLDSLGGAVEFVGGVALVDSRTGPSDMVFDADLIAEFELLVEPVQVNGGQPWQF